MLSVLRAFWHVFLICVEYVSFVSSVSPRILGVCVVGSCVLFMVSIGVWLYCAGSGVNSVAVVFVALSLRLLAMVQLCMLLRCGCMLF